MTLKARESIKYLEQIKRSEVLIGQIQNRIEMLKDRARSTPTSKITNTPVKNSVHSDIYDLVDEYVVLEEKAQNEIKDLTVLQDKVINGIWQLDNINYINVLYKKYVEYKSFDEIADEMAYSYGHITKMHGKALEAYYNINLKESTA